MNVTFTKAEAEFIGQLAQLPVTLPLAQVTQAAAIWTSILKKVEKLTEGNEEKGGENSAAAVAGRQ
jgi:hypothetical protein